MRKILIAGAVVSLLVGGMYLGQSEVLKGSLTRRGATVGMPIVVYKYAANELHNLPRAYVNMYSVRPLSDTVYEGTLLETRQTMVNGGPAVFKVQQGVVVDFVGFAEQTNATKTRTWTFTTPPYKNFSGEDRTIGRLCQVNGRDVARKLSRNGQEECISEGGVHTADSFVRVANGAGANTAAVEVWPQDSANITSRVTDAYVTLMEDGTDRMLGIVYTGSRGGATFIVNKGQRFYYDAFKDGKIYGGRVTPYSETPQVFYVTNNGRAIRNPYVTPPVDNALRLVAYPENSAEQRRGSATPVAETGSTPFKGMNFSLGKIDFTLLDLEEKVPNRIPASQGFRLADMKGDLAFPGLVKPVVSLVDTSKDVDGMAVSSKPTIDLTTNPKIDLTPLKDVKLTVDLPPTGTVTTAPAPATENSRCVSINPYEVGVDLNSTTGKYALVDRQQNYTLEVFDSLEEVYRSLSILQFYSFKQHCVVGSTVAAKEMVYWLDGNGVGIKNAPSTTLKEDCVGFNTKALTVKQNGAKFTVSDQNHQVVSSATRDGAEKIVRTMQQFGFNQQCFVGRPGPSFTYYKVK